jgi:hypothetical protein
MKRQILIYWRPLVAVCVALALPRAFSQQPVPTVPVVGLREKAAASGSYVTYASPSIAPTYNDLNQLVLASTDIITGTAISNQTRLTPDGTFITTDYDVQVASVLYGHLQPGATITVSLPGGFLVFDTPSGVTGSGAVSQTQTYAAVRTPWFKKMSNGKQYILFLAAFGTYIPGAGITGVVSLTKQPINHYETAGGPQGVFEITSGGVVTSNSGRLRDPMWQYNNLPVGTFQTETQVAIASEHP